MKQQIAILAALLAGVSNISAQIGFLPFEPNEGAPYDSKKNVICRIDSNYVRTYTFTAEKARAYNITQEHFDGLGRKGASIQHSFGPDLQDVISYVLYDSLGREWRTTLPSPKGTHTSVGLYGETNPFSETIYENSPLNRIIKSYGPGEKWRNRGKAVSTSYLTNGKKIDGVGQKDNGNHCLHLVLDALHIEPHIAIQGYWPARTLSVIKTEDESGGEVYVFKDEQERVILTRKILGRKELDTYMVYDAKGRLTAVLPPLASADLSSKTLLAPNDEEMSLYAYLYRYDSRDRCIAKKLPGCEWTYYVYDKGDRLVFTQDAELRKEGKWAFSFTDVHGRPCLSGVCAGTREELTQAVADINVLAVRTDENAWNNFLGYTSPMGLWEKLHILSVSYYDDYSFIDYAPINYMSTLMYGTIGLSDKTDEDAVYDERVIDENSENLDEVGHNWNRDDNMLYEVIAEEPTIEFPLMYASKWDYVQGRLTGTAKRILGEEATNDFRWEVYYYDKKGNVIQSRSTRQDGGIDVTSTSFSFTGKPKYACVSHNDDARSKLVEFYKYTYDNWDRPLSIKHRLGFNQQWTTLSDIKYDAAGRKVSDNRNGHASLQTSFTYNVRSWLTGITGPGLNEEISYDPIPENHVIGQTTREEWGGNITSIKYSYICNSDSIALSHAYRYDDLSRVVSSSTKKGEDFTREEYVYDDHTNLVSYSRTGAAPVSKIMSYAGNRMTSVEASAAGGVICYDDIGRIISSDIEGMTQVRYNVVGYPSFIAQADGGYVHNTYTAGGQRLESRRTDAQGTVTTMSYEGNEIFENGKLRMLLFDGGYVDFSGSEPRYCWYTKDHLGSVRAVADAEGNIIATYGYMPYGEEMATLSIPDEVIPEESEDTGSSINPGFTLPNVNYSASSPGNWQPFKFSGKESLTRVGLDLYDFGARMYSPSAMRWMTMDPLCEKHFDISPYVYCFGNPIRYADPDGRDGKDKIVGWVVGTVTNIIPGSTGLRDIYTPNDSGDYNDALKACDDAAEAVGTGLIAGGGDMFAAAEATAAASAAASVPLALSGYGTVAVEVEVAGVASVSIAGAVSTLVGARVLMNAAPNKLAGYERGGTKAEKPRDSGKNEKHGDGGRSLSKSEKQRAELQNKIDNATSNKERKQYEKRLQHIKQTGEKNAKGEEHSRGNKR